MKNINHNNENNENKVKIEIEFKDKINLEKLIIQIKRVHSPYWQDFIPIITLYILSYIKYQRSNIY